MSQPAPSVKPDRNKPVSSGRQSPGKRRFTTVLWRWIVPALCVGVVLTLGSSLFSLVKTSMVFDPLMARIAPGLGPDATYQLQVLLRHSAHLIEYATLFLILSLGPLRGRPIAALMVCIAVASLDESLQLLTATRSGKLSDVAEDTSGATIVLLLALPYWEHLRHLRQSSSKT